MSDPVRISVGGKEVTEVFQLKDARMEVNWIPVDQAIDPEFQYLATRSDLAVQRTQAQVEAQNDPVDYLFTEQGLWKGIRCPKDVWSLYMSAKNVEQDDIDLFIQAWTKSPIKGLIDKESWDEKVKAVAEERPWEQQ